MLLVLTADITFGQINTEDEVPEIRFTTLLNANTKSAKLSGLKGKVVLIEFWATWCGSCLVAMPHLKTLQAKYPKALQIIAVTDESATRAQQFIKSKPQNFWIVSDTAATIAKMFPHQLIPHSVLISPAGKLIATTSPELITEKVIDSILRRQQVHLAEKRDSMISADELIKRNFFASDTVQARFLMQNEIKGASGMSTTWLNDASFSKRRLTAINLPLSSLYAIAFGNFPYGRTINKIKSTKDEAIYCLDIISKSPDQLLPDLQQALAKRFDVQAMVQQMQQEVQVLKIVDPAKFNALKRNQSGKRTYYSRHGEIDQQALTMTNFADFLENYGVHKLVTDETSNQEKFDIKFSFQPEDPKTLLAILSDMGLSLVKEQRPVDMLILYELEN